MSRTPQNSAGRITPSVSYAKVSFSSEKDGPNRAMSSSHAYIHLLEQLEQRPAVAVHDVRLAAAAAGIVVDAVGDAAVLAVDGAPVAAQHQRLHPHRVHLLLPGRGIIISRRRSSGAWVEVSGERLDLSDGH